MNYCDGRTAAPINLKTTPWDLLCSWIRVRLSDQLAWAGTALAASLLGCSVSKVISKRTLLSLHRHSESNYGLWKQSKDGTCGAQRISIILLSAKVYEIFLSVKIQVPKACNMACNRLTKNYGGDFKGHRRFSWWHSGRHNANYEKKLNETWHSEVHGVDNLVYMAYIGLYKLILYFLPMCRKL